MAWARASSTPLYSARDVTRCVMMVTSCCEPVPTPMRTLSPRISSPMSAPVSPSGAAVPVTLPGRHS